MHARPTRDTPLVAACSAHQRVRWLPAILHTHVVVWLPAILVLHTLSHTVAACPPSCTHTHRGVWGDALNATVHEMVSVFAISRHAWYAASEAGRSQTASWPNVTPSLAPLRSVQFSRPHYNILSTVVVLPVINQHHNVTQPITTPLSTPLPSVLVRSCSHGWHRHRWHTGRTITDFFNDFIIITDRTIACSARVCVCVRAESHVPGQWLLAHPYLQACCTWDSAPTDTSPW